MLAIKKQNTASMIESFHDAMTNEDFKQREAPEFLKRSRLTGVDSSM